MEQGYVTLHPGATEFKLGAGTTQTVSNFSTTATNGQTLLTMPTGGVSHRVIAWGAQMSESVSGGTAIVLTLYSCPKSSSDATNARTIGTCTIPSSAVIDDCLVNFPTSNLEVNPGERLIIVLTTKSTTDGKGYLFIHTAPYLSYTPSAGTYSKPVATAAGSIKVVAS